MSCQQRHLDCEMWTPGSGLLSMLVIRSLAVCRGQNNIQVPVVVRKADPHISKRFLRFSPRSRVQVQGRSAVVIVNVFRSSNKVGVSSSLVAVGRHMVSAVLAVPDTLRPWRPLRHLPQPAYCPLAPIPAPPASPSFPQAAQHTAPPSSVDSSDKSHQSPVSSS